MASRTSGASGATVGANRATTLPPRSMTYFSKSRLTTPSLATRIVRAAVATLGEPFKWGTSPDELEPFLDERGWTVIDDISTQEAATKLMPPDLARSVRSADSRVALAVRR